MAGPILWSRGENPEREISPFIAAADDSAFCGLKTKSENGAGEDQQAGIVFFGAELPARHTQAGQQDETPYGCCSRLCSICIRTLRFTGLVRKSLHPACRASCLLVSNT